MKLLVILAAACTTSISAGNVQEKPSLIEMYANWAEKREILAYIDGIYGDGGGYCSEIPTQLVYPGYQHWGNKSLEQLHDEADVILQRKFIVKYVLAPVAMGIAAAGLILTKVV